jgi:hypothetical protein
MSIYSNLIARGYTKADILKAAKQSAGPRQFNLAVADTPDGELLVGLSYRCDYRAEEEWGIRDIRKALGIENDQWLIARDRRNHIGHFADAASLIISVDPLSTDGILWGSDVATQMGSNVARGSVARGESRFAEYYDQYFIETLSSAHRFPTSGYSLKWKKIPELKEIAKELGLVKLPTKKTDLIARILQSDAYRASAETPDIWPGWFHDGTALILKADCGIVAETLNLLYEASLAGTLALGGGEMIFGTGLSFYDGADVGPRLQQERTDMILWRAEQAKALEPVMVELENRGYNMIRIGKAQIQELEDGTEVIRYWLNGNINQYSRNVYGWYSLEELLSEKFLDDAKEKVSS